MPMELSIRKPTWQKDLGLTLFSHDPVEHAKILGPIDMAARAIQTKENLLALVNLCKQWSDESLFKVMHNSDVLCQLMSNDHFDDFWKVKINYLAQEATDLITHQLILLKQSENRHLHFIAGGDIDESTHIQLMQQCQEHINDIATKSEGLRSQWQECYRLFYGATTIIAQQYPSDHWLFEIVKLPKESHSRSTMSGG